MRTFSIPFILTSLIGAQVYGCIFMRYSPAQPFVAKFIHGGQKIHCMIHGGYDNSVRVTRSGVTCADIQYVESKASSSGGDLCATDTSYWGLSYSTSGSEPVYSGDMISRWQTGNSADFVGTFSKGTRFCKNQTYCEYTWVDWPSGTQGPLYVSPQQNILFVVSLILNTF